MALRRQQPSAATTMTTAAAAAMRMLSQRQREYSQAVMRSRTEFTHECTAAASAFLTRVGKMG
eukprot:4310743-Prymnesium_polylepis.1